MKGLCNRLTEEGDERVFQRLFQELIELLDRPEDEEKAVSRVNSEPY
jgi:hypothetical protein